MTKRWAMVSVCNLRIFFFYFDNSFFWPSQIFSTIYNVLQKCECFILETASGGNFCQGQSYVLIVVHMLDTKIIYRLPVPWKKEFRARWDHDNVNLLGICRNLWGRGWGLGAFTLHGILNLKRASDDIWVTLYKISVQFSLIFIAFRLSLVHWGFPSLTRYDLN